MDGNPKAVPKERGMAAPEVIVESEEKAVSSREPQGLHLRFSMEIAITAMPTDTAREIAQCSTRRWLLAGR